MEEAQKKRKGRGSDSFENKKLNFPVTGLCSADFVTENCLLKSVAFGSVVAASRQAAFLLRWKDHHT